MYNNVRQVFHTNAVILNKIKCIQPNAPLAFATRSSVSGSVQDPLQAGMSSYTGVTVAALRPTEHQRHLRLTFSGRCVAFLAPGSGLDQQSGRRHVVGVVLSVDV